MDIERRVQNNNFYDRAKRIISITTIAIGGFILLTPTATTIFNYIFNQFNYSQITNRLIETSEEIRRVDQQLRQIGSRIEELRSFNRRATNRQD